MRAVNVWVIEEVCGDWGSLYWQETQIQSQHLTSGHTERRSRRKMKWRRRQPENPPADGSFHFANRGHIQLLLSLHTHTLSTLKSDFQTLLSDQSLSSLHNSLLFCRRDFQPPKAKPNRCFLKEGQQRLTDNPCCYFDVKKIGSQSLKSSCRPQRTLCFHNAGS